MNFFINGWGSTADVWQGLIKPPDICYDISERESYADIEQALTWAWQKNNCQPLCLIGWSLGSLLALELAAKRPEIISHVLLFGATAHFAGEQDADCQKPIIVKNMLRHLRRNAQKTVTDFWNLMFSPSEQDFCQKFLAQFDVPKNEKALSYGLCYLLEADMRKELAKLNVPITLIHGANDAVCPLASAQYLKDNLPKAELIVFAHCGHLPFFTRQDECRALLGR